MVRRVCVTASSLLIAGRDRAHAQLAVIDPANLAQAVLIAERAQRHYEELQAQYRTILRMAQGLGNMERYRIPAIAATSARRRPVALRPAVAAGPQQRRSRRVPPTGRRRSRSSARQRCLTASRAAARRTLERQYATIEITDSVAMMGGHQVGAVARLSRTAAARRAGPRRRCAERPAPATTR